MNKIKLHDWLGIIGHLAVLAGLVVVAIELHQNSIVANSELSAQYMESWGEWDRSRQDPDFAQVYAKSIERPEELTLTEMVQLDGYYWVAFNQLQLAGMLVENEVFFSSYEDILRENVGLIFTTPFSRAWWDAHKSFFDSPEAAAIVDEELEKVSPDKHQELFDAIESNLSK